MNYQKKKKKKKMKAMSIKKLTMDLINKFSILNGAKYFSSDIFRNNLVFISAKIYIKYYIVTTCIDSFKSSGMKQEIIENITKSDISFTPTSVNHHVLPRINFNGHCLISNDISIPKKP